MARVSRPMSKSQNEIYIRKNQHVIDESMIRLLKPKHPISEFGGDFDIQYSNMSISTYKIIWNNLKIT
jgi:hypothetical protein